jgi:NADH:ubiquinone oxidoreductase subunit
MCGISFDIVSSIIITAFKYTELSLTEHYSRKMKYLPKGAITTPGKRGTQTSCYFKGTVGSD